MQISQRVPGCGTSVCHIRQEKVATVRWQTRNRPVKCLQSHLRSVRSKLGVTQREQH